ncbi:hypothetical protein [Methanobacterium formicicum]|nr:hypothetical protein [Methanobacterium formicicum]
MGAIESYEKAVGTNQKNEIAWYNKGLSLIKLYEYKKAIKCR